MRIEHIPIQGQYMMYPIGSTSKANAALIKPKKIKILAIFLNSFACSIMIDLTQLCLVNVKVKVSTLAEHAGNQIIFFKLCVVHLFAKIIIIRVV